MTSSRSFRNPVDQKVNFLDKTEAAAKKKKRTTAVRQAGPRGVETNRQAEMTVDDDSDIDMSITHPVLK
ncbi:hypothetical protein CCR75_000312 [Bremia lactucae]|uniref:Uncharacterized protein n=1 Tax=Bremia lactucae TaxID=4779 RepID=A0A976FKM6_BRELC|nr:hypothetical protein CCR75_000312 [Bremia lactucae]